MPWWKAPAGDRFQVINEHSPSNFHFDSHFFGIERSADCVFIQLALIDSRTADQKAAFYRAVAGGLHERLGMRTEDVFINLLPVDKADWSFGNGKASLIQS